MMELYSLDDKFIPRKLINPFISAIWTERYYEAGDFQIVVLSPSILADELARGRFLAMRGSKEIMVIENRSIEKGVLTATGRSISVLFNEREALFPDPNYDPEDPAALAYKDYVTSYQNAGHFLTDVVVRTLIAPDIYTDFYAGLNFVWGREILEGLSIGVVDENGDAKTLSFPIGPIYDGITKVAKEQHLGFKVYLESANAVVHEYNWVFSTYRGTDRTSHQTVNRLIRMSPALDSLLDPKELVSLDDYKNVVYVMFKNKLSIHYSGHYIPLGLKRRVIRVDAPDHKAFDDPEDEVKFRNQIAWNAFIAHQQKIIVDGEVTTVAGHKFTKDYYLGDAIELQGQDGLISAAQVTEHIRSQDQYGFKEFPSLSLIDPAIFNFDTDLGEGGVLGEGDPTIVIDPAPAPRMVLSYARRVPGYHGDPEGGTDPDPDDDPGYIRMRTLGGITADAKLKMLWNNEEEAWPSSWTPDHTKLVIRSYISEEFGGSINFTYWMINPDGSEPYQLTETMQDTGDDGSAYDSAPDRLTVWANSDHAMHVFTSRKRGGTDIITKFLVDIYEAHTFNVSDLTVILGAENFPPGQQLIHPYLYVSPNGLKLHISREDFNTNIRYWYLSDVDGANLMLLDFGYGPGEVFGPMYWSEDSTKLYGLVADGVSYLVYELATGVTTPYSITKSGDLERVFMAPNGTKIAWLEVDSGGLLWLYVGSLDGTTYTLLYHKSDTDPDTADTLTPSNKLVWSFDSTKIAIIDERPQSSIWVFDVNTGASSKAYPGDGWDGDSKKMPYLDNPMLFGA